MKVVLCKDRNCTSVHLIRMHDYLTKHQLHTWQSKTGFVDTKIEIRCTCKEGVQCYDEQGDIHAVIGGFNPLANGSQDFLWENPLVFISGCTKTGAVVAFHPDYEQMTRDIIRRTF